MSRHKGFRPSPRPIEVLPLQDVSVDPQHLDELRQRLQSDNRITSETRRVLLSRFDMGYRERLAENLSSMLAQLRVCRIHTVLDDGLTVQEKRALAELQLLRLPSRELSAAHLLLGVLDRAEFLQFLKGIMPTCRRRHTVGIVVDSDRD